ncbi:translocase [Salipiger sp. P9]|uniref:translocase n=1 Tax=Salipiger pentaromativorans TaxID=2943193 RepID=UPI0021572CCD|nr:translocase [Salipiger pentaromativorans]MCR8548758.1 translocase [Salipiger pentaromativorans]
MARLKTYLLAVVTIFTALAIGYVMQNGSVPTQASRAQPAELVVSGITDTSSALTPRLPVEAAVAGLPDARVVLAAADSAPQVAEPMPQDHAAPGFDCALDVSAMANAGAMVDLSIVAPCHASERVTIHHHGLMFTEITQPDGTLRVRVPALSEHALFIVAFDNGTGGTASTEVPALPFYDRVVLQWKGQTGLQLHAREFDAAYFTEGHVWAASAGDMERTARGEGGFLSRLGNAEAPEPLMAEVYSFPVATTHRSGRVAVSVEAEVTEANCGSDVEAQTLERHGDTGLRARDLTLDMPACDSIGDFLVLKNLIEDLKIAGN